MMHPLTITSIAVFAAVWCLILLGIVVSHRFWKRVANELQSADVQLVTKSESSTMAHPFLSRRKPSIYPQTITLPSRFFRWILALSGLWWAGLPGFKPSIIHLTAFPSYVTMVGTAVLSISDFFFVSTANQRSSDSVAITISALYLTSGALSRSRFSRIGSMFHSDIPFISNGIQTRIWKRMTYFAIWFVILTILLAFNTVLSSLFSSFEGAQVYAALFFVAVAGVYLHVTTSLLSLVLVGSVCSASLKVLRRSIQQIVRGEPTAELPTPAACAYCYGQLHRYMRNVSTDLSFVPLPAMALVVYVIVNGFVRIAFGSGQLYTQIPVIIVSAGTMFASLIPMANVSRELMELRLELGNIYLRTDENMFHSSATVWFPASDFQQNSVAFQSMRESHAATSSQLSDADRKTFVDMLSAMDSAKHCGLTLFGAEITPGTVLRLGWITASAIIVLIQVIFFSNLRTAEA
jgi:hypothetical protein